MQEFLLYKSSQAALWMLGVSERIKKARCRRNGGIYLGLDNMLTRIQLKSYIEWYEEKHSA